MKEKMEWKIGEIEKKIISQKVQELEKKLESIRTNPGNYKIIPASPVKVKLSIFDGKRNWQIYKTQFFIVDNANDWKDDMKVCQVAASLTWEAADILQTLPDLGHLNFQSLCSAPELRFGEKFFKDYTWTQMKTHCQKSSESLQEHAWEIERLANLAFTDCPPNFREMLTL